MSFESVVVFGIEETELINNVHEKATEVFGSVETVTVNNSDTIDDDVDLCVAVGGDGSYLESVYRFSQYDTDIIGIHNGSLGFLSRVPPENTTELFNSMANGEYNRIKRGRVLAEIDNTDFSAPGLNEVMIQPTAPEKAVDRKICSLHVYISNTYIGQFDGSGIAVATPTGSTAVALSAGGPVHYPNNNFSLQLTPLQTHNIGVRPVIFDADTELRVYADSEVNVMVDGGREMKTLEPDTELTITGADQSASLIRTEYDDSFFDALSDKLGWSLRDIDETGPYRIDN